MKKTLIGKPKSLRRQGITMMKLRLLVCMNPQAIPGIDLITMNHRLSVITFPWLLTMITGLKMAVVIVRIFVLKVVPKHGIWLHDQI